MDRFDIRRVAMGLTAYAIERQNGFERHQPEDSPPWQEQRRFWTDAILQGMARLDGLTPDPKLMEQYDLELEQARGCYFTVPATQQMQKDTIRELRCFVAALEASGDDRRRQVNVVRELLEGMSLHPHWWNGKNNGLDLARDEADRALVRMTAQMPIRFTYIALGGDAGPHWASGFVSGCVTDTDAVKQTAVYQDAIRNYPEVTSWPALCTVHVGRGLSSALGTVDASDFDLEIMNRTGDRFLGERGVSWLSGPYQMIISTFENIRALRVRPGKMPETIDIPNILDALQAEVSGYIEVLGLDCGVCLICNEEGKLRGFPANRQVGGDIIAGTFLIVGEADGEFCSLSDADAAHYAAEFAQPMPSHGGPDEPTQWTFHVY